MIFRRVHKIAKETISFDMSVSLSGTTFWLPLEGLQECEHFLKIC